MLNIIICIGATILTIDFITNFFKKGLVKEQLKEKINNMSISHEKSSQMLSKKIKEQNKLIAKFETEISQLKRQVEKSNEIYSDNIIQIINITQEITDVHETFLDKLTVLDNYLDNQDNQSAKELLKSFLTTDVQQIDQYMQMINIEREQHLKRIHEKKMEHGLNSIEMELD